MFFALIIIHGLWSSGLFCLMLNFVLFMFCLLFSEIRQIQVIPVSKHYNLKIYGGFGDKIPHIFFILTLEGGLPLSAFIPSKKVLNSHCLRG
jgi:hypothetical protein